MGCCVCKSCKEGGKYWRHYQKFVVGINVGKDVDPSFYEPYLDAFAYVGLTKAHVIRLLNVFFQVDTDKGGTISTLEMLMFLDVDCIAMRHCISLLAQALSMHDALLCADVRYLGPDDARASWEEAALLTAGRPHPARSFPDHGVREEKNAGLFWSLAFALRRTSFDALGGFDEGFVGYGAEDTDFGFRAAESGLRMMFVGQAIVCHQYHDNYEPPVQHVADIVRNAVRFRARWNRWPMEGWLEAFARMGLVTLDKDRLKLVRMPTRAETAASRVEPAGWPSNK